MSNVKQREEMEQAVNATLLAAAVAAKEIHPNATPEQVREEAKGLLLRAIIVLTNSAQR